MTSRGRAGDDRERETTGRHERRPSGAIGTIGGGARGGARRAARWCALACALASTAALAAPPRARTVAKAARGNGARYAQSVKRWHEATPGKSPSLDGAGRPMLVLHAINTQERIELAAASDRGGFAASDLDRAARLLREPSSGNEHPIEPRLLDVVYRIQTHFGAQEVRFISAYRTPRGRGSNHGHGRAMDLIVPGATDDAVARFARELGYCGVGIYPTSGFVHVDVRARSYFWVDSSGPGRRNRERGILGDLAKRSDGEATARGEVSLPPIALARDVDTLWRGAGAPAPSAGTPADQSDDDDDLETPADAPAP